MTNLSTEPVDLAQKVTQLDKELSIVSQESRELQDQLVQKDKDILQKVCKGSGLIMAKNRQEHTVPKFDARWRCGSTKSFALFLSIFMTMYYDGLKLIYKAFRPHHVFGIDRAF